MTDEEKRALVKAHPKCYFVRVQKAGYEAIIAIPKISKDDRIVDVPGGGTISLDMLHGATVRL